MMSQCYTHLKFIVTMLLFLIVEGCTALSPIKPNEPYQGPFPESFDILAQENPLLVEELKRIPEFQDGISVTEAAALEKIAEFYIDHPEGFDRAFEQMYQIGLPDRRKYCTPLQALFWLAEDGKLNNQSELLLNFSLKKFLLSTWNFKFTLRSDLSKDQLLTIINGIKNKEEKERYLRALNTAENSDMQNMLSLELKTHPNMFSRNVHKIIKQSLISKNSLRWEDFEVVTDRLNAPELVDFYEQSQILWVDPRELPTPIVSPEYVFKHKKGDCISITGFTIHCLSKNGYSAWEKRVPSVLPKYPFHVVCAFMVNGKKYIMDNGKSRPSGIIPYYDKK